VAVVFTAMDIEISGNMEAPRASEMFVSCHVTTRCHYSNDRDLNMTEPQTQSYIG